MTTTTPEIVVIGDGPVGRTTSELALDQGRRVRVATRSGSGPAGAELERADVLDPDAIARSIGDAPLVVMATHAPYRASVWVDLLPRMEAPVLAHAARTGATVVFPESLYGFAAERTPITAATRLDPRSRKGAVRKSLIEARVASGARTRSVVAGDFIGPRVTMSVAGDTLTGRLVAGKSPQVIGRADLPHAFTYVPDLARALLASADLPDAGHRLLMAPNAGPITQRDLVKGLAATAGLPEPKIVELRPWLMALLGIAIPDIRELREVSYQFLQPFTIDASADEQELGLQATAWPQVQEATIAWWRDRAESLRS